MKLRTGLNPYGLSYHLGLHARGTPRANPKAVGLEGFIALATELPDLGALDQSVGLPPQPHLRELSKIPAVADDPMLLGQAPRQERGLHPLLNG